MSFGRFNPPSAHEATQQLKIVIPITVHLIAPADGATSVSLTPARRWLRNAYNKRLHIRFQLGLYRKYLLFDYIAQPVRSLITSPEI